MTKSKNRQIVSQTSNSTLTNINQTKIMEFGQYEQDFNQLISLLQDPEAATSVEQVHDNLQKVLKQMEKYADGNTEYQSKVRERVKY
jgi:uncharacterized membrane protein YccC